METLHLLGTALGLGALAGINLYLTVFVAGLAIQQQWITLAPQYADLQILGHPVIILIAGILYTLQFFADKIPWVDSLWDLVHSVIRPVGGAALAIQALGSSSPVFDISIALLAGGVALSTHSLKAGARLVANGSPEPFSNIALSVGEDVAVLGGLVLLQTNPVLALAIVILLVASIIYFGPKIARAVRIKVWLAWRKLNSPAGGAQPISELPKTLPADADILLHSLKGPNAPGVKWAVSCIASGSKRLKSNISGHLVALEDDPDRFHFVSKGWFRTSSKTLELEECKSTHESKFLSENLVLYSLNRRWKEVFLFERGQRHLVVKLVEEISIRPAPKPSEPNPIQPIQAPLLHQPTPPQEEPQTPPDASPAGI